MNIIDGMNVLRATADVYGPDGIAYTRESYQRGRMEIPIDATKKPYTLAINFRQLEVTDPMPDVADALHKLAEQSARNVELADRLREKERVLSATYRDMDQQQTDYEAIIQGLNEQVAALNDALAQNQKTIKDLKAELEREKYVSHTADRMYSAALDLEQRAARAAQTHERYTHLRNELQSRPAQAMTDCANVPRRRWWGGRR